MDVDTVMPNAEWWQGYGAIGLVAFFAVTGMTAAVRHYLAERREEKERSIKDKLALQSSLEAQQKALQDLNAKLVEFVQNSHHETLELLDQQREDHDTRYQALMERHMNATDKAAEKNHEIATIVTRAIDVLSRKIKDGG